MIVYPDIDPIAIALGPVKIHWYGISYLVAFAGGVVSFLSPCVLPLVPGYLSMVTGLDIGTLGGTYSAAAEDQRIVLRARKLQRYLTQPFHVVTAHTGIKGVSVTLKQTLTDCEAFMRGDYDVISEEQCYMRGSMQE